MWQKRRKKSYFYAAVAVGGEDDEDADYVVTWRKMLLGCEVYLTADEEDGCVDDDDDYNGWHRRYVTG